MNIFRKFIPIIFTLASFIVSAVVDIRYDGHSHALDSDSDNKHDDTWGDIWSVSDSTNWHIDNNYNTIAISNHWDLIHPSNLTILNSKYKNKLVILPALEWSPNNMHFIFTFNPEIYMRDFDMLQFEFMNKFIYSTPNCVTRSDVDSIFKYVHDKFEGVITLAHPFFTSISSAAHKCEYRINITDLTFLNLDCVEVVSMCVEETDETIQSAIHHGLKLVTGTDSHTIESAFACGVTKFKAEQFEMQSVFNALKNKNDTTTIYEYHMTRIITNKLFQYGFFILCFICMFMLSFTLFYLYVKCSNTRTHESEIII
jgi:hypothetical protein